MKTIKSIQQLQNITNLKHQLIEFCKLKKGKKMIEVILSIIQKSSTLVQIIDPNLLDLYHYKPIYYSIGLLCILLNIYIKYKNRNP